MKPQITRTFVMF